MPLVWLALAVIVMRKAILRERAQHRLLDPPDPPIHVRRIPR